MQKDLNPKLQLITLGIQEGRVVSQAAAAPTILDQSVMSRHEMFKKDEPQQLNLELERLGRLGREFDSVPVSRAENKRQPNFEASPKKLGNSPSAPRLRDN